MKPEIEAIPEDEYISLANFCDETIALLIDTADELHGHADALLAHAEAFRKKLDG